MYLSFLLVCLSVCPVHYHYISTVSIYIYSIYKLGCVTGGSTPLKVQKDGCSVPATGLYICRVH